MKKGFSMVEIAIVLVIIGIITALAVGGMNLLDASKRKADFNKVMKIKAAISTYYTKYGHLPGERNAGADMKSSDMHSDLLREGSLTANDFEITNRSSYYHFIGCGNGNGWKAGKMAKRNGEFPYICIMENITSPSSYNSANFSGIGKDVQYRDICYYETLLDDKNTLTGEGMTIGQSGIDLKQCSKEQVGSAPYLFRVF